MAPTRKLVAAGLESSKLQAWLAAAGQNAKVPMRGAVAPTRKKKKTSILEAGRSGDRRLQDLFTVLQHARRLEGSADYS